MERKFIVPQPSSMTVCVFGIAIIGLFCPTCLARSFICFVLSWKRVTEVNNNPLSHSNDQTGRKRRLRITVHPWHWAEYVYKAGISLLCTRPYRRVSMDMYEYNKSCMHELRWLGRCAHGRQDWGKKALIISRRQKQFRLSAVWIRIHVVVVVVVVVSPLFLSWPLQHRSCDVPHCICTRVFTLTHFYCHGQKIIAVFSPVHVYYNSTVIEISVQRKRDP